MSFALLVTLIVGCKKSDNGNSTLSPGGSETSENFIYSEKDGATLVADGDSVSEENLNKLKEHLSKKTGKFVAVKDSATLSTGAEIVLGRSEREISKKAYTQLERLDLKKETEVRFIIYSDGKSVAIAYDDAFLGLEAAQDEAISSFINEYCTSTNLKMESGVYKKESFCVLERQEKFDSVLLDEAWDNAYSQMKSLYGDDFADESIASLKALYTLYDDGAISWLANLFDAEIGGFYYSNSARDTVGYLPDLESTGQALSLVESTGMFDNYAQSVRVGMPEWFGERLVAFTRGLQAADNGYFYHPQWTRAQSDSNSARLGRDLTNATNILNRFNAKPYYDTPNGIKGELPVGTAPTSVALSSRLYDQKAVAVSSVLLVNYDDSAVKAHLRTEQAFRNYLADLNDDIIVNDYKVGNLLESQATQIAARDLVLEERKESYRLSDILAEWLTSKQNPDTGLWAVGNKNDYDAVNGLLKISSTYSRIGKAVPNAELGLRSAVKALTSETPIRHVCDILNPWYAIMILTANISNYSKNSSVISEVKAEIIATYTEAVKATTEKLSVLRRPDGSFGYLPESSSPTSQEMPVAVPDSYEGDVNASYLAISSIPQHMFASIGIDYVAPYTEADRLNFVYIIEGLGAIIKDDVLPAETITFNDEPLNEASASADITVNSSGGAEVALDPERPSNRVLKIDSYADGAGIGSDNVSFKVSNKRFGNACFVFECNIYVSGESRQGNFAQLNMGTELFMLNIGQKDGKVLLSESSSTNGAYAVVYDIGEVANADDWFNLRIEYYTGEDDTVRIKLFIDRKLLVVSDNYYDHRGEKLLGAGIPNSKYIETRFVMFSDCRGKIYLDNVILDKSTNAYTPHLDPDDQPLLRNVDAPESDPVIHDFEAGYNENLIDNTGAEIIDTDTGKALSFDTSGNSVLINAHARGKNANAALFESKIFVPESSAVGAKLGISFCDIGSGKSVLMGIHLVLSEDSSGKYLSVAEGIGNSTGDFIGDTRIPIGKAFTLRVEFFFKKSVSAIYADDTLIGATLTSANGSNMKYFGLARIASLSQGKFILDDIRVERVNLSDFKENDRITHSFNNGFGEASASGKISITNGAASFSEAGVGDALRFPVNKRSDVPSTYVAEFEFKLSPSFTDGGAFGITLLDSRNEPIVAYDIVGSNGKILIYEVTGNGRYPTHVATAESLKNLSVRYSKKLGVSIIRADGECLATSNVEYSDGSFGLSYSFAEVAMLEGNGSFAVASCIAEISMQDFEIASPEYKAELEEGRLIYEFDSSIDLPSAITHELASGGAKVGVKEIIRVAERSKALSFVSTAGGKDVLKISPTDFSVSTPRVVAFDTDILITSNSAKSWFEIEPVHGDTRAYKLTVTVNRDGDITVSGADISTTVIAKEGEWFRMRIEYSNPDKDLNGDGRKDIRLSVFVNGEKTPRATGYTPYTSTAYGAEEISAVRFFTWTDSDMEILLDNTFAGGIESSDGENEGGSDIGGSAGGNNESDFGNGDVISSGGNDYDDDAWQNGNK